MTPHIPEGDMFAWPADAPAAVREFDWEDGTERPHLAWAAALTPSVALAALATLAVHATVL